MSTFEGLITVDNLKTHSQLTETNFELTTEEFTTLCENIITQTEGLIESYCRVPTGFFRSGGVEFTDQTCETGETLIKLPNRPVLAVTKIEVNTAAYGSADNWETLESNDYILNMDTGVAAVFSTISRELNGARASYTAGYTSTPAAIEYVTLQLATNVLYAILERKLSPTVRLNNTMLQLVIPECFTAELKQSLTGFVRRLS